MYQETTSLRAKGETMFNESRARATQQWPAIAKSHKAGAERAHVYSILYQLPRSVGATTRRRQHDFWKI